MDTNKIKLFFTLFLMIVTIVSILWIVVWFIRKPPEKNTNTLCLDACCEHPDIYLQCFSNVQPDLQSYKNYDMKEFGYTYEQCASQCIYNPQCKFMSYTKKDGIYDTCIHGYNTPFFDTLTVEPTPPLQNSRLALKERVYQCPTGFQCYPNQAYDDISVSSNVLVTSNVMECVKVCQRDSNCKAMSYSTTNCYLYDNILDATKIPTKLSFIAEKI